MLDPHGALIYTMVIVTAADANLPDAELQAIGDIIGDLPVFRGFDRKGLPRHLNDCAELLNRDDGLELDRAYIAAACRCAPPDNKPLPREVSNCRGYLERELEILKPKAILALGKIAWDAYLKILKQRGVIASRTPYRFAHGAEAEVAPETPRLFAVYHPSQQNTQTGRVTPAMYCKVLARIRRLLETLPASFKPISRS